MGGGGRGKAQIIRLQDAFKGNNICSKTAPDIVERYFGSLHGSDPSTLRDSDLSSSLRLSTLRSSRVQRSSVESNMAPDLSIDNENVSLGSRLSLRRGREMLRSTAVVVRENRKKPRVAERCATVTSPSLAYGAAYHHDFASNESPGRR